MSWAAFLCLWYNLLFLIFFASAFGGMATFCVDIVFDYFMVWCSLCSTWVDSFLHEGMDRWFEMNKPFPAWIAYTIFSYILNLPLMVYLWLKKWNRVKMCYTFVWPKRICSMIQLGYHKQNNSVKRAIVSIILCNKYSTLNDQFQNKNNMDGFFFEY